jgi:hypothetical protein
MQGELFDWPSTDGERWPPDRQKPLKENWLATTALTAAAYDDKDLIAQCSPSEVNSATVRGLILLCNVATTAALFATGAHYLLNSDFSFGITLGAIFLAAFLGLVDHYAFLRSAVFPDGMKLLRKGGFTIDVRLGSGIASRLCKSLRLMLALALGGLEAILIALLLNRAAVDARIEAKYLAQNKAIVERTVNEFSGDRLRLATAYDAQLRLVTTLSSQVEKLSANEARNTLRAAGRKGPSKALEQSRTDLSDHRKTLAEGNGRLAELKDDLRRVDAARGSVIHEAIERAPGHIPRDDSIIARTKALFEELHDDPVAAVPALLLDSVVVGLDLAVLPLKGIAMPSTYSMLDTKRALRSMTQQARLAEADTAPIAPADPASGRDHPDKPEGINGGTPPRRGRGRPRKNPIVGLPKTEATNV